jgi:hypothetical protein
MPALELARKQVQKDVEEALNHLRDLGELQYSPEVERYVINSNAQVDVCHSSLRNIFNNKIDPKLSDAELEELRMYMRNIRGQFPEIQAEYTYAKRKLEEVGLEKVEPKGATPRQEKDFWDFLRKPRDTAPVPLAAVARARADRSPGRPLEPVVRRPMEVRLGASFADVRVHADARSASLAEGIHAEAFTRGQDIYFGADRYQPGTFEGRRLLAHELTHVIQHIKGAAPRTDTDETGSAHERETGGKAGAAAELLLFLERSLQAKPAGRDADNPVEKEANRIADLATRMFIPASGVDSAVPLMSKPVQPNCLDCEKKDEDEQN